MKNNSLLNELSNFFEKNDASELTSTLFSVAIRDAAENPSLYKETEILDELEALVQLITYTSVEIRKKPFISEYPDDAFQHYINHVVSKFAHSSEIGRESGMQADFMERLMELKTAEKNMKEFLTKINPL